MRKKMIVCDICGEEITNAFIRYKFKRYRETYAHYGDCEFLKKWTKLDMCRCCYNKFIKFVNLRSDIE